MFTGKAKRATYYLPVVICLCTFELMANIVFCELQSFKPLVVHFARPPLVCVACCGRRVVCRDQPPALNLRVFAHVPSTDGAEWLRGWVDINTYCLTQPSFSLYCIAYAPFASLSASCQSVHVHSWLLTPCFASCSLSPRITPLRRHALPRCAAPPKLKAHTHADVLRVIVCLSHTHSYFWAGVITVGMILYTVVPTCTFQSSAAASLALWPSSCAC